MLSQLLIGLRSSASQAGHGLLAPVSEPRAWMGEMTGKMLHVARSSKGRDHQSVGSPGPGEALNTQK